MTRKVSARAAVVSVIPVEDSRAPAKFTWRGRRYRVRRVLANWVEAGCWWSGMSGGSAPADGSALLMRDREVWRVEAALGGVYDLGYSPDNQEWRLLRIWD